MPKHDCPYCACNYEGTPTVHPYIEDPADEGCPSTYCPECGAYQTEDAPIEGFGSESRLTMIDNFPKSGIHTLRCNHCGLTSLLDENLPTEKDCGRCLQPLLPIHDSEGHGFHDWCHEDTYPNLGEVYEGEDSTPLCKQCLDDKRRADIDSSWGSGNFSLSSKWFSR
jgi:hypothetical protein